LKPKLLLVSVFPKQVVRKIPLLLSLTMFVALRGSTAFSRLSRHVSPSVGVLGTLSYETFSGKRMFATRPPLALRRRLRNLKAISKKPTIHEARLLPRDPSEMDGPTLVTLAAMGNFDARKEAVIRDIMCKDNIDYDECKKKFRDIEVKNSEYISIVALPYRVGIFVSLGAAFGSFPMIFDLGTAEWVSLVYPSTVVCGVSVV
jgi:hypothetical protein